MIQLVAFLGNYGSEYADTRHNVAWLFQDSLPFASEFSWSRKFKSDFFAADFTDLVSWLCDRGLLKKRGDGSLPLPAEHPSKVYFLKPLTYMNLSGEAIGEAARFYKIPAEDILVVHDEIELPLSIVSLKHGGGLGGHNGLRSAKAVLGTADFWRLRFGVGKPAGGDVAGYVLGAFSADERIVLSQVFMRTEEFFAELITSREPQRLLSEWGKKKL